MFQQAMGHLSNMNASGRVEAFRGFAAQISKADPSWKATELAARNATVFAGDAGGRIIAFDQSGNMFRGIGAQTSAALQIQKGGEIVVDFLKLTPIK
jgi:hypothetical protein